MISFERLGITPPRLIWAGCLVTLLYAAFSLGTYHPDEHFQILEYAHMKLFGTPTPDHLPWEYLLQMRPGIQPFVAWAVGKGLLAAGIYSPFAVVFVLQLLSGALSAAALLFFYRTVRDDLRDENARCWFLLLGFFLWYLAYLHVHFNAEMISGNLLLLLAALTMRCHRAVGRREFGRGVLLGMTRYSAVMVVFAIVFALLMNRIRHSRLSSTDTVIGVFSSCGVALGLVLLSRGGDFAKYQSLLIGDILSISAPELIALAVTLAAVAVVWLLCFNQLHAVSISPALARSKGIPVGWLDNLFVVIIAVVVMLAIQWVGLLIINAMLILPAAAARNVAGSMRSYHLLALIFGLFSGVLGLFLSYFNAVAAGPTIVLVAAALFFGTFLLRDKNRG